MEAQPIETPVVKTGGDNHVSFDELEAVMSKPNEAAEVQTPMAEKSDDEAKVEKIVDKADKGVKDALNAKKEAKLNGKEEAKVHKYKIDEKEYEVRSDSVFEVKVNGKKESVPFQELLNNYSGKTDLSRKYTDLDKQQKQFTQERTMLQKDIDSLYDMCVKESNPRGAIEYLAELLGGKGTDVWANLKKQVLAGREEWDKLTPDERRLKEIEDENRYYQKREEARYSETQKQKSMRETQTHIESVKEKYGMNDQAFVKAYDAIVASRKIDPNRITPEHVGEYHSLTHKSELVSTMFGELEIELDGEGKMTNAIHDVWMKNPEMSQDDIKDIITQVYGGKSAKNLSRKIKRSEPTNTGKPTPERKSNPVTFDDLD